MVAFYWLHAHAVNRPKRRDCDRLRLGWAGHTATHELASQGARCCVGRASTPAHAAARFEREGPHFDVGASMNLRFLRETVTQPAHPRPAAVRTPRTNTLARPLPRSNYNPAPTGLTGRWTRDNYRHVIDAANPLSSLMTTSASGRLFFTSTTDTCLDACFAARCDAAACRFEDPGPYLATGVPSAPGLPGLARLAAGQLWAPVASPAHPRIRAAAERFSRHGVLLLVG